MRCLFLWFQSLSCPVHIMEATGASQVSYQYGPQAKKSCPPLVYIVKLLLLSTLTVSVFLKSSHKSLHWLKGGRHAMVGSVKRQEHSEPPACSVIFADFGKT